MYLPTKVDNQLYDSMNEHFENFIDSVVYCPFNEIMNLANELILMICS